MNLHLISANKLGIVHLMQVFGDREKTDMKIMTLMIMTLMIMMMQNRLVVLHKKWSTYLVIMLARRKHLLVRRKNLLPRRKHLLPRRKHLLPRQEMILAGQTYTRKEEAE